MVSAALPAFASGHPAAQTGGLFVGSLANLPSEATQVLAKLANHFQPDAFAHLNCHVEVHGEQIFAFGPDVWQAEAVGRELQLYEALDQLDLAGSTVREFVRLGLQRGGMAYKATGVPLLVVRRSVVLERAGDQLTLEIDPIDKGDVDLQAVIWPPLVARVRATDAERSPWVEFPTSFRFLGFGSTIERPGAYYNARVRAIELADAHLEDFSKKRAAIRGRISARIDGLSVAQWPGAMAASLPTAVRKRLDALAASEDPPRPAAWVHGAKVVRVSDDIIVRTHVSGHGDVDIEVP